MGFFKSSDINDYLLSTYNRLLNSMYLMVLILMAPIIYFDFQIALKTDKFLISISDSIITLILLTLYLLRKKLSFQFRSLFISFILLGHTCVLLTNLGLASEAFVLLLFIIVLNSVLYGKRLGWITILLSTTILITYTLLLKYGYITYSDKLVSYSNDPSIWINRGISFTIYGMVLFFFIIHTRKVLDSSLQQYSLKNTELQSVNLALENQIQENKLLNQSLAENEERYRMLASMSPDGIIVHVRGIIKYANPFILELMGAKSQREVIGSNALDFVHPSSVEDVKKRIIEITKNRKPIPFIEEKYIAFDGSIVEVETSARPIIYDNTEAVLVIMRSLSDRKKQQQIIRKQKEYLETILENIPLGIFAKYIPNNYSFSVWNRKMEQIFGNKKEDIIGKTDYDLVSNVEEIEYFRKTDEKVMLDGKVIDIPYEIVNTENGTFQVHTLKVPMYDSDGKPDTLLGIIEDISERSAMERELKISQTALVAQRDLSLSLSKCSTSEQLFNEITEVLKRFEDIDFIEIYQSTTNHEYKLYSLKKTKKEFPIQKKQFIIDHKTEKLLNKGKTLYFSSKEIPSVLKSFSENEAILSYSILPINNKSKNIAIVIAGSRALKEIPLNLISSFETFTLIMQNFLDRIEKESELEKAKNKAEESDKLKSAFLANMSHEIRTPMNGILGFAELLNSPELPEEKQRQFVEIINRSSKQLLSIINDIIDISKIESGLIAINNNTFNLNETISEIFEFFHPIATLKNIDFILNNRINEDLLIITDDVKLKQILNNLISNAIKFTDKGKIEISIALQNNQIEFNIKDSGIGIEKEYIDYIFERFRQVEYSNKRNYGGTGLGLAIAKAYTELLGGKIYVQSEVDNGSTFNFSIPYLIPEHNPNHKNSIYCNTPILTGIKMIVAEDEEINFAYLKELLDLTNVEILHALNGYEAIELLKNNPDVSLILLDMKMPLLNGYEAIKHLKTINPNIPIIAQTAFAFSDERKSALESGCDDYLAKPISKVALYSKIREQLERFS